MKRTAWFTAFALALPAAAAAQTVTARVGGELTGFTGSYVDLPVVVDMSNAAGAKLGSYTARLSWDPTVLLLSCEGRCDTLSGNFAAPQVNQDSVAQGVLRFGAISPVGASGLVTVSSFRFLVSKAASSAVGLSFSEMSATANFASLLPGLTVNGATFCIARGRWGDLDQDGFSNSRDALAILSQVVGLTVDPQVFPDMSLGDADGDGKVNSRDALIILSYAVGLNIAGERVLLPAPSSCGTGSASQLSVFPAAAELVVTQPLKLLLQGSDSAGRAVTVPAADWRSSDPTVAGVDPDGTVRPRQNGTATITGAVGPGIQAAAVITVVNRRPNWYVDVHASGSALELGTIDHPFEHPTQAYAMVSEGDTIRVASGTYYFDVDGQLNVGAIIVGGTPGDTTTRPVFRDIGCCNDAPPVGKTLRQSVSRVSAGGGVNAAFRLGGGQRTVVRNLVLSNFYEAVYLSGVRSFAIEDSRIEMVPGSGVYGEGIYSCGSAVDSVRVDRSAFVGDSTGYAIELDGCARIGLLLVRDSKILNWGSGVYLYGTDSTAVIRSEVSGNDGYGLYTQGGAGVRPALYVAHSRVERSYYEDVYAYEARRLVIDTSVVRATAGDAIDVYGYDTNALVQVYLHGDSIYQEENGADYDWLYADYADSLVMYASTVRLSDSSNYAYAYGDVYANVGLVTFSHFLNLGDDASGTFYFEGSEFHGDSLSFAGCNDPGTYPGGGSAAGCDGGTGLDIESSSSTLNASVTRSRFTKVAYPLYHYSVGGTLSATNLVMDSVAIGMQLNGDSDYVAHNVLTRVSNQGIALQTSSGSARTTALLGNNISCSAGGGIGIDLTSPWRFLVSADTVASCGFGVVVASAYPVPGATLIQGGALRGNGIGVKVSNADTSSVQVDSIGISGSVTAAVEVDYGHVVVTRSRLENNAQFGLSIPGTPGSTTAAHQNSLVGNAVYGVSAPGAAIVDATNNYWGVDTGPCTGGDCFFGMGVNTTPFLALAGLPPLPGLAPRVFATAATSIRAGSSAPRPVAAVQPITRVAVSPRSVQSARIPVGATPAVAARIQGSIDRRNAQFAKDAAVRDARIARRKARQAEKAARQPS